MEEIEEIAKNLIDLGFSTYEAKTLASLFALGPSTARELSEASGVPRPKIYEVLKGLLEKGVVEVQYGKPMIYVPTDPKNFIERMERRYRMVLKSLRSSLERIRREEPTKKIYASTIMGDRGALSKLREALLRAKEEIYLIIRDPRIFKEIREILKARLESGIRVICFITFHDRDLISELRTLGAEVYSLKGIKEVSPTLLEVLEVVEHEKLISAVNVDGNAMYFIFLESSLVGVWVEIKVLAKIQVTMLKNLFKVKSFRSQ